MSLDLKEVSLQRERLLGQIVNSPERIRREMADQQSALDSERQECMQCEKAAHQTELGIESVKRAKGDVMAAVRADTFHFAMLCPEVDNQPFPPTDNCS